MLESFQAVAVAILGVLFGLSWLANRYSTVAWLQAFRISLPELTEEQRERQRRRGQVYAGIEFILLGMIIPAVYFVMTLMFFTTPSRTGMALVALSSVLCFAIGVVAIWRSGKPRRR